MPSCKQKNAILALTPTLNLTQTVTLALINPKVNPYLNLKFQPQLTTNDNNLKNKNNDNNLKNNDNNLKNKKVLEQISTHSCSRILSKQSSFAR